MERLGFAEVSAAAQKDLDHFGDWAVSCTCWKMDLRFAKLGFPKLGRQWRALLIFKGECLLTMSKAAPRGARSLLEIQDSHV